MVWLIVFNVTFNTFSYMMAVSFIGGVTRSNLRKLFYLHGTSTVDPDEGQITKDPGLMSASAKLDRSQSDTDISNVEERMSLSS
jgi:hypothetical protein